ncbi:hypothetical protein EON83_00420 [bacterium]|nr:MAG: hypothetical protein EON83_00420 [bacterium]
MLTLEAHDLAHDGDRPPPNSATEANWQGERWQIGLGGTTRLTERAPRIVVCQKQGCALLCLTHISQLDPDHHNKLRELDDSYHPSPFELRMSFAHSIEVQKWGRAFFLNERLQRRQPGEEARFFLLLSPHGWGFWRDLLNKPSPHAHSTGEWGFVWSQTDERNWLFSTTAAEVLRRITDQFDAPDCDSTFALRFASLSFAERRKLVWPCKRGDTEQMERVLLNALLSQEEFWEWESRASWDLNLKGWSHKDRYNYAHISHMNGRWIDELDEAFHRVFDFFEPRLDDELIGRHLCAKDDSFEHMCIEVESPSIHERLEGTIEWRDWQEAHLPE